VPLKAIFAAKLAHPKLGARVVFTEASDHLTGTVHQGKRRVRRLRQAPNKDNPPFERRIRAGLESVTVPQKR
jgi:hypothetical protein